MLIKVAATRSEREMAGKGGGGGQGSEENEGERGGWRRKDGMENLSR